MLNSRETARFQNSDTKQMKFSFLKWLREERREYYVPIYFALIYYTYTSDQINKKVGN